MRYKNASQHSLLTILLNLWLLLNFASATEHCTPTDTQSWSDLSDVVVAHRGPYTYIQNDTRNSITLYGDDLIKSFTVDFADAGSIRLQQWRPVMDGGAGSSGRSYLLVKDQVVSTTSAGSHSIEVNWDLENDDVWGFSYDGEGDVPIRAKSDSSSRAMSDFTYVGGSEQLGRVHVMNQDSPFSFRIQVCTAQRIATDDRTRTAATSGNYSCNRRSSWLNAMQNDNGPVTYIHGKKITSPRAILRDIEVEMVDSGFIRVQVWRKDVSNYEFVLVKEKTYYAKQGYNMLPANLDMNYGEHWGFTYDSAGAGLILYENSLSNSSYLFDSNITGIGSKVSYADSAPTTRDYKISPCIEDMNSASNQNGSFNSMYGVNSMYSQGYSQYPNNNGGQYSANMYYGNNGMNNNSNYNYMTNNSMNLSLPSQNYSNQMLPNYSMNNNWLYASQQQQQMAPKCECKDNSYWFSATLTENGPYTYIDGESYDKSTGNIQAFEIEAHLAGDITLQLWRPNMMYPNALELVWEKEVSLKPGYQRINISQPIQYGYRWGFIQTRSGELPIKYFEDFSSKSNEFGYAVSNSTGQSIYMTSSKISYKKFKIRPCGCSNQDSPMMNNPVSLQNQYSLAANQSQNMNCMGSLEQYGLYDAIGPYTYIDFTQLQAGNLQNVEVVGRNFGMVTFNVWRYNSNNSTFEIIYEKPLSIKIGMNNFQINTEVQDDDLYGFGYQGYGVVPIQFSQNQSSKAYETNQVYSQMSNNTSINVPSSFVNKKFNMRVCMRLANSSTSWNQNANSQQQQQQPGQMSIQTSQSIVNLIMEFLNAMSNSLGSSSSSGSSEIGECMADSESSGPYNFQADGPYTYIGDFGDLADKCIKKITYTAQSENEVVFIMVEPEANGYAIKDRVAATPTNVGDVNEVSVEWCLTGAQRIGFYYERADKVPISFTYYWGSAFELFDAPSDDTLPSLYETSKSFDIKLCTGSDGTSNAYDQQQQQTNVGAGSQPQMNGSYYGYNQGYAGNSYSPYGGYNGQQSQQYGGVNQWYSPYSMNNANYNNQMYSPYGSNQYGASSSANWQAGYGNSQRSLDYQYQYGMPNSSYSPYMNFNNLINGLYSQAQPKKPCIGSLGLYTQKMNDSQGPLVHVLDDALEKDGALDQLNIESATPNLLTLFIVRKENNSMAIHYAKDVNLMPGLNTLSYRDLNWNLQSGDMIGFVSVQQMTNIPYTLDQMSGQMQYALELCVSDSNNLMMTPQQGQLPQYSSNQSGSCKCGDMSHWQQAYQQSFGPFVYLNGQDLMSGSGYIDAFEVGSDFSGVVTLHLWRKASPYSDRMTQIWSRTVDLRAGYQRIDGLNANFQQGDLWGFTFAGNGISPIPYAFNNGQNSYEKTNPNNSTVEFMSNLRYANKLYKINPCICLYNNQNVSSAQNGTYGGSTSLNYNYQQGGNVPVDPSVSQNFGSTNNYQFCYGQTTQNGNQTKYGPFTYINFEPLPAGSIDYISFDAFLPGELTWQLWRLNANQEFEVVASLETQFEAGTQNIEFVFDTEENDLIGFHYAGEGEIPIKFSKFVGAQSYEDFSAVPPVVGTTIPSPDRLVDQIFNYRVCMYSVTNSGPLVTTSNIGGYGNSNDSFYNQNNNATMNGNMNSYYGQQMQSPYQQPYNVSQYYAYQANNTNGTYQNPYGGAQQNNQYQGSYGMYNQQPNYNANAQFNYNYQYQQPQY